MVVMNRHYLVVLLLFGLIVYGLSALLKDGGFREEDISDYTPKIDWSVTHSSATTPFADGSLVAPSMRNAHSVSLFHHAPAGATYSPASSAQQAVPSVPVYTS